MGCSNADWASEPSSTDRKSSTGSLCSLSNSSSIFPYSKHLNVHHLFTVIMFKLDLFLPATWIPKDDVSADIFTTSLPSAVFSCYRDTLDLYSFPIISFPFFSFLVSFFHSILMGVCWPYGWVRTSHLHVIPLFLLHHVHSSVVNGQPLLTHGGCHTICVSRYLGLQVYRVVCRTEKMIF